MSRKFVRLAVVLSAIMTTVACGSSSDGPSSRTPMIPTFSSPTPVPGRVNNANDGTSFEPCVDIGAAALSAAGVDPATWTDISRALGGPRGCRAVRTTTTLTALVVNGGTNELYAYQGGSGPRVDVDSVDVNGGSVTHHRFTRVPLCVASIRAGAATLSVSLADSTIHNADRTELCARADRVIRSVAAMAQRETAETPSTGIPTPVGFHSFAANDYTILIQAGIIDQPARTSIRVLDGTGRLLTAAQLQRLNPQSSTRVSSALMDLRRAVA